MTAIDPPDTHWHRCPHCGRCWRHPDGPAPGKTHVCLCGHASAIVVHDVTLAERTAFEAEKGEACVRTPQEGGTS